MILDLNTMSRKELAKLSSDVDKAIKHAEERDRKAALKAAQKAARDYGFTLEDVVSTPPRAKATRNASKRTKQVSVPKYANPNNTSQTWSGKGRQPEWFKQAMQAGTDPGQMEVNV